MLPNAPNSHDRFTALERSIAILPGGIFTAYAELNSKVLASDGSGVEEHSATGVAYLHEYSDHAVISNIGSSGLDGIVIEPDRLRSGREIRLISFGPAAGQTGSVNFQFRVRFGTDATPTELMSLNLTSDGAAVHVNVDPEQSSTPYFKITLKNQGVIAAEFLHSDPLAAIADLPEWPTGLGYLVQEYGDQPWLMYVDLGQGMLVDFPDPPLPVSGASAGQVQADAIIVTAQATPQPPSPTKMTPRLTISGSAYVMYSTSQNGPPSAVDTRLPGASVLHVGYPNPFNPSTTLAFELAQPGRATLTVYDVSGAVVAVLYDGVLPAGPYEKHWDGTDRRGARAASGFYFVELRAPDGRSYTKISLLK